MAMQTRPAPIGAPSGSDPVEPHDVWNFRIRGEAPAQRLDRCYTELLQEVQVAQTGVQVLLAFLLWVAFNPGFSSVTSYRRGLYVVALVLATLALALLIAPACANRVTYRRSLRAATLTLANRCAIGGTVLLFASLNCVLALILDVVLGSTLAAALGFTTVMWFALWWYILPLMVRRRHSHLRGSKSPSPWLAWGDTVLGHVVRHHRDACRCVCSTSCSAGLLAGWLFSPEPVRPRTSRSWFAATRTRSYVGRIRTHGSTGPTVLPSPH
ncbi:DUF6328 family protein [Planosporangium sp. 12N6]|uniref:DUF6328 family protein n=1 Tax=Planosporangium spinosum TaxID=3402278 RepID=UPI003CE72085